MNSVYAGVPLAMELERTDGATASMDEQHTYSDNDIIVSIYRANGKPRLMMLAQWLCDQVEWRITGKAGDGLSEIPSLSRRRRTRSPIVWPDPPTDKKYCQYCEYIHPIENCKVGDCQYDDCSYYIEYKKANPDADIPDD